MSKRQRHLYYICNFLVFAALAMVNTVMIPYMKAVGYSLMQQSVILAANALIAIIGQFLFGYLCDRHHSMKRFFLIAYISFVAGTCLMLIREDQLFWYHLFSIALSSGLVKVVSGLNETWMLLADADRRIYRPDDVFPQPHVGISRPFCAHPRPFGTLQGRKKREVC